MDASKVTLMTGIVTDYRERVAPFQPVAQMVQYTTSFRIGNHPMHLGFSGTVANGDNVTVAVYEGCKECAVLGLKNNTTGVLYMPMDPYSSKKFMIIFSILTIPLMGIGFFLLWTSINAIRTQQRIRDFNRDVRRKLESA